MKKLKMEYRNGGFRMKIMVPLVEGKAGFNSQIHIYYNGKSAFGQN